MNTEWSALVKEIQTQLKKESSFSDGIETLLKLRRELMGQILDFKKELTKEEMSCAPYSNATGYRSKTVAYSLFHIFRIEDIVSNSLIGKGREQVFFEKGYQSKMGALVTTTGNELTKEQIKDFSERLDLEQLYEYIKEVDESTEKLVKELSFGDIKRKMTQQEAEYLHTLNSVSEDETAVWLITYWCSKDVKGLIEMPFSRHWIMHIEACIHIKDKLLSCR